MLAYTVYSEAGGVGKTTLATNLAKAEVRAGRKVLAIDLDTRIKKRRREQSPGGDVLDNALKTAEIPLLRIRASREYDPHEVQQQLRFALAVSEEPVREWFREEEAGQETHDTLQRLLGDWLPGFGRLTSGLRGAVRRA